MAVIFLYLTCRTSWIIDVGGRSSAWMKSSDILGRRVSIVSSVAAFVFSTFKSTLTLLYKCRTRTGSSHNHTRIVDWKRASNLFESTLDSSIFTGFTISNNASHCSLAHFLFNITSLLHEIDKFFRRVILWSKSFSSVEWNTRNGKKLTLDDEFFQSYSIEWCYFNNEFLIINR